MVIGLPPDGIFPGRTFYFLFLGAFGFLFLPHLSAFLCLYR